MFVDLMADSIIKQFFAEGDIQGLVTVPDSFYYKSFASHFSNRTFGLVVECAQKSIFVQATMTIAQERIVASFRER
jgi:hypothetical protein